MRSIIALPNDYTVIDFETTGFNPKWEGILELGAIKYRDGKEVSRYQQLVLPSQPISMFITRLTGITNEMLIGKPTIDAVIGDFADFIGDDILIGHNVAGFDTVFLADAYEKYLGKTLVNSCVDTLRISKRLFPGLRYYSLGIISAELNVEYKDAHRGLSDCEITNACYQTMRNMILTNGTLEDFQDSFEKRKSSRINVNEIVARVCDIDPNHPLFSKVVVFTGALGMPRIEAMQIAVDFGAIVKTSVTTKTDYLVVGEQDISRVGDDCMSSKEEKAIRFNKSGKAKIQIIAEDDFLRMVKK